jgi:CubicO group peptidase (beta-lactamase class C family)
MPSEFVTPEKIAQIDQLFAAWDTPDTPGAALAVIHDGAIVYERGYGMSNLEHGVSITPDSIFHVASMSKQFTATCVAILVSEGKLDLDADVRRYLPELPHYGPTITLRHMLHHTSGLRDHWDLQHLAGWRDDDLITGGDVLEIVARQKGVNFTPGAEWLYSNSGYSLLADVVQRTTGQTLRQFAEERIFGPLGMERTHFHDDHNEIVPGRTQAYVERKEGGYRISNPVFDTVGTTSLFTTVRDYFLWDQNFAHGQVGGAAIIQQLQTPGCLNHGVPHFYGFGLQVYEYRGVKMVEHSGGDAGYRSHYLRLPEHHFSVVVLANTPQVRPQLKANQIVDLCLAEQLQPVELPAGPMPSQEQLVAKAGWYCNPATGDLIRLTSSGDRLVLGEDDEEAGRLVPLSANAFEIQGWGRSVAQFEPDGRAFTIRDFYSTNGFPPHFERVEAASPSADELLEYTGVYVSDELGVDWEIDDAAEGLVVKRRKFAPEPLTPVDRDVFAQGGYHRLSFTRDASGFVDGFLVSSGRVRNVRFERV